MHGINLVLICSQFLHAFGSELILQFWNKSSVQSVIKCSINDNSWQKTPQELDNIENWNQIVASYQCQPEEKPVLFSFKGKTDNYKLEGAGKLRLGKNIDLNHVHDNLCISLGVKNVQEMVGSFKNGQVHGPAKITFADDGGLIIANFKHGQYFGLKRDWSSDGVLEQVSYFNKVIMSSSWWKHAGNYLIYSPNTAKIHAGPAQMEFVLDLATNETFIGNYVKSLDVLENVFKVQVDEAMLDSNDCLMQPKWKHAEEMDFVLLLAKRRKYFVKKQTCPMDIKSRNLQEAFKAWQDSIFINNNDLGPHNLYNLKPFQDIPMKPLKLDNSLMKNVSWISFKQGLLNMTILDGQPAKFKALDCTVDDELKLHGYCQLDTNLHQIPFLKSHPMLGWIIMSIRGNFVHGQLEGKASLACTNHAVIFATFQHGVMHGPVFGHGVSPLYHRYMHDHGFKLLRPQYAEQGVHFMGFFKDGQPFGHFWIQMLSQGYLHGHFGTSNLVSGDNIAYIYPDGVTALKGHFEDKEMKEAFHHDVLEYDCDEMGMVYVKTYSERLSEFVFKFEPPTNVSFGGGGLWPDPYDVKYVQVQKSKGKSSI